MRYHSCLPLLVLMLGAGTVLADAAADPEAAEKRMIDDAKALAASSLPDLAQLGPEWKRAWELPGTAQAACPSQDEYWNRVSGSMGLAGIDQPTATAILDNMMKQVAGQGGAEGLTARDGMVSLMSMLSNTNSPTAAKTLQYWESTAKTFQTVAQAGETPQERATKSNRRMLDMAGEPWKSLADEQLHNLVVSTMTLIRRRTTMEYFRCNDWGSLSNNKSADDAVKTGVWMGVVKLNLLIADQDRLQEVQDLKADDVPKFQPRLSSAVHAMSTALFQIQRGDLQKKMEAATDDYAKKRVQDDIDKLDKEAAAAQAMTVTVVPRQFGDNSYVIRIKGTAPDQPSGPVGLYAGWLRRGAAMVEISLNGNFPEDVLNKEMDHFLSEMDAKLASYDSSLAGTMNLSGPAPQFAPAPVPPTNVSPTPQSPATAAPRLNDPVPAGPSSNNRAPVAPPPAPPIAPPTPPAPPTPTAPLAEIAQAESFYNASQFDLARQAYDRILAAHPNDARALMMRGASKYYLNDLAGAKADYEASAKADPTSPAARKYWAFLELIAGNPKLALELSDSVLRQNGRDVDALVTAGEAAIANGAPREGQKYLEKARQLDPNRAASLYSEGCNAFTRNSKAIALQLFRGALLIDPNQYQAWFGEGEALAALGQKKAAMAAYRHYLQYDRNSPYAQHAREQIERLQH